MTPQLKSILIRWLAALFGATVLFIVLGILSDEIYRKAWLYFAGTLFVVCNLYMLMVVRTVMDQNSKSVGVMLAAVALKQLFSLVFILIYLVKFYKQDNNEIWICFATFFVYSLISYYFSFQASK